MGDMTMLKQGMLFFMSEKCYQTFFLKLDLLNVKAPQIMKIFSNKSATGINLLNCLTDLYAISTYFSYSFVKGFPFSAYGDAVFVGIQTLMITTLVLYYNQSAASAYSFTAIYLCFVFALAGGLTPVNVLWFMQVVSVPIMFFGKLAQAFTNYKNKGTGQLSAATCGLLFFGALARVFTSIQETGDFLIIFTYFLATVGNGAVAAQFILYRDTKPAKKVSGKAE
ncbi:unnamed protein product [Nesidiocoris tenuis]|uniref:Mannose-P-dolichol utilization defect 1 protein homolog n=1 Tax=Nesidiocoris tenuis TaxID=355587 RepID=A0A6H5GA92_9HEMI|nr:unnamed protein product [Nesidiocoris tenuis]CAA9999532.1 unnamed protein product [Nesidiocoris tenuis]